MYVTLAELRSAKKLSQRDLAAELSRIEQGIRFAPATIALYELGLRTPGLKRAKIIARYFDVPVERIAFGHDAHETQLDRVSIYNP